MLFSSLVYPGNQETSQRTHEVWIRNEWAFVFQPIVALHFNRDWEESVPSVNLNPTCRRSLYCARSLASLTSSAPYPQV
jgi:hypothetical protein